LPNISSSSIRPVSSKTAPSAPARLLAIVWLILLSLNTFKYPSLAKLLADSRAAAAAFYFSIYAARASSIEPYSRPYS